MESGENERNQMKTNETNETKHTPGPWVVVPSSNLGNGTAWRDIVSTGTPFAPSYVGEAQAQDAELMAAAPRLLELLDEVLCKQNKTATQAQEMRNEAVALIHKLKGTK
jgi:hypothetical protein